jgi:hypothetical protein
VRCFILQYAESNSDLPYKKAKEGIIRYMYVFSVIHQNPKILFLKVIHDNQY